MWRCGELLIGLYRSRYGVSLLVPLVRRPRLDGERVDMLEQSGLCDCVVDESMAVEQLHAYEAFGGYEQVQLAALCTRRSCTRRTVNESCRHTSDLSQRAHGGE